MKKIVLTFVILCVAISSYATFYDTTSGLYCTVVGDFQVAIDKPSSYTGKYYSSYRGYDTKIPATVESPSNYTYRVVAIADSAFSGVSSVSSLTLASTITSIGVAAFSGCGMTSVILPSALKTIGNSAFANSRLYSINIPASVTDIGLGAFWNSYLLMYITVDSANTKYSAADGVLFNKDKNTLIHFPEDYSDKTTHSVITSYKIPSTVTSISANAFLWNTHIKSLTIPSSVKTLSQGAFWGCSSLADVYCYLPKPIELGADTSVFYQVAQKNHNLHVLKGTSSLYANASQWKKFNIVEDLTAGIEETQAATFKAYVNQGNLILTGLSQSSNNLPLNVYTLQGTSVYSATTAKQFQPIALPGKGIYIVKIGTQAVKVIY